MATTHGMRHTKIYGVYHSMRNRCRNKNVSCYRNYGGRGIECEWDTFEAFYTDIGKLYKEGLTIERIDNDLNYCKDNCTWTSRKNQANNTRRNRNIEFNGIIKTLQQWSDSTGINRRTIAYRIDNGWSIEKTLII